MKLVCIDRDSCGFYSRVDKLEGNEYIAPLPSCPDCGGIAVLFNKNYTPAFYTNEQGVDQLLAAIHNLYTEKLNEEDTQ